MLLHHLKRIAACAYDSRRLSASRETWYQTPHHPSMAIRALSGSFNQTVATHENMVHARPKSSETENPPHPTSIITTDISVLCARWEHQKRLRLNSITSDLSRSNIKTLAELDPISDMHTSRSECTNPNLEEGSMVVAKLPNKEEKVAVSYAEAQQTT